MEKSLGSQIMDSILSKRAQQLFLLSDKEGKGFISKRDMQRMRSEIPFSPEQLEAVFDSLDVKGKGYLTIEEFLEGFGGFLNSHAASNGTKARSRMRNGTSELIYSSDVEDSEEDIKSPEQDNAEHFDYLLQHIHSTNMLHNVEVLRQLCQRVQRDASPQVQNNLKLFLQQLNQDLRRRQHEQWQLEENIRAREEDHNKQVQKLFEEMQMQLSEEKSFYKREEEERQRLSRKVLEEELMQKEEFIRDVLAERQKMSEQLQEYRTRESSARQENLQLLRGKEEVELKLDEQYREMYGLHKSLHELQSNQELKKQTHISAGFCLARRIMLEQQGLLHQLQLLRQMANTISNQKSSDDETPTSKVESSKTEENMTQYPSIDSTSGFLDDYEDYEDFYHPIFQRSELLKSSLESQTSTSSFGDKHRSNVQSLRDELASTQKLLNNDLNQRTETPKSC